jgi:hypothetical protein
MAITNRKLFVEKHPEGYQVRRPNAGRASAVEPTQNQAIQRAKEIEPKAHPDVERVRKTGHGRPGEWRKA